MNLYATNGKSIPDDLPISPKIDETSAIKLQRGFLIINKPVGKTSHDVVDCVRKIFGIKKVGHGGTLDPMVTGVLPIGLGEGTKLLRFLLESGKIYDCEMLLHNDAEANQIEKVLHNQLGTITQLPPIKSRVKRIERERDIYSIDIYKIQKRRVFFRVHCEAGTYIRKLCHDVGEELGTGAQMQGLNRISAGGFEISESITLEKLEEIANFDKSGRSAMKFVHPLEKMVQNKPKIWVDNFASKTIQNGAKLAAPGVIAFEQFSAEQTVFLFNPEGFLIAVAKAVIDSDLGQQISKGIVAETLRIIKITEFN